MAGARSKAVVLSLVAHAAIGISLWHVSRDEPTPAAYDLEIDIAEPAEEVHETPEPEPVEEEPEPAAEARPSEPARAEPAPPAAADEAAAATGPAALATGVEMENPAPGGDGPAAPSGRQPAPARPPPAAAHPADPPERPGAPAACDEPATKPKPVDRPRDIQYLDDARAREIEGRLVLAVSVASDGSVAGVEVQSPVDPSLDAAAVEAVRTWRFEPARRCGKPVDGTFTLARRFVLGD